MKTRAEELHNISEQKFDLCVIGGGATGSACALDAQLRGIRTVLLEAGDFAGATSSAATKIVHGGVRYLEEAIKGADLQEYRVLVRALHERVRMRKTRRTSRDRWSSSYLAIAGLTWRISILA